MRVEYVGCERLTVTVDDLSDVDCPRLRNGLHAIEGHCHRCDNRIRVSKPIVYRVTDSNGRVITADWCYL